MPIAVICPTCSARLNAPDAAAGKKVKCPKCQAAMLVPEQLPEAQAFEVVDPSPPPAKKPLARVKADVFVDDDEDQKPRKKPVKAQRDDDEDEDDDRPKKKKKQAAGNSTLIRNIVGVAILLPLLGFAGYIFYDRFKGDKEEEKTTKPSGNPTPPPPPNIPLPGAEGGPVLAGGPAQPATLTAPSGFKVTFPGPYAADDPPQDIRNRIGLPIRFYRSGDPATQTMMFAASVDLPAGASAADKNQVYDRVVKTLIEDDKKVEIQSRQKINAGGREWEEITIKEGTTVVGTLRLLPTDTAIYLLAVANEKGTAPADAVKRFFDSFELTK